MNPNKAFVLPLTLFFACLMLLNAASALTVSVTQSGADNDEVMKGRTFIVEASGWTDSCSQATISFEGGCSSCSLSGENAVKTIGGGATSVSWTTTSASQQATAQKVSVSVSGGCTMQQGDSSNFDIVLPPSLSVEASTSASSVDAGSTFASNLNIVNSGETAANDVSIDVSGTGMSISSDCASISTIDEGQSAGQTCTILASTAGTQTVTFTVSSINADSVSDSFSITVNSVGGGTPGGPGGPSGPGGVVPPSEGEENRSKKFDLVPGVGLRNNTKLQAAIEKVLGKGKLSDQALENLMRLSSSITSELEVNKDMKSSSSGSNITAKIKYRGERTVKNFVLHEKIPKAFASSSDDITVSVSGATYEVVEKDPEYLFLFPEIEKDQTITIVYSVDSEVDTSVLDQTETVVYGEVYEGLEEGMICAAGEMRCSGDDLQQCSADGKSWETVRTCTYGCENKQCKAGPEFLIDTTLVIMSALVVVIIVVVIILAMALKKRTKKSGLLPNAMPRMKPSPSEFR